MKKALFFAVFLAACCLLSGGYYLKNVSAQNEVKEFDLNSSIQEERAVKDRELANTIREFTNRSAAGLTERPIPGGGTLIDLEGRFQNVMLARLDADGDSTTACVTSLDEAFEFFGRSLETGERLPFSERFQKDDTAALAARHGMSEEEFKFYLKMIETADLSRLASPTSTTINIVNKDAAGEGFNDATATAPEGTGAATNNGATLGAQRLNVFNFAAGIWGAFLDSRVPINIDATFDPLACSSGSAVLGSAGTTATAANFTNREFPNTSYHFALANKQAGVDLGGGGLSQIAARFNSNFDTGCFAAGHRFYYGLDNSTPAQRTNLLVVVLHEIGHGLGFSNFVSSLSVAGATNSAPIVITSNSHGLTNGEQVIIQGVSGNTAANGTWIVANATANTFELSGSAGNGAYTSGGTIITGKFASTNPDIFSRFMFDRTTNKYWNQMTNVERQASALNNSNVLWDGANVKIASGFLTAGREASTGRVQLFTPATFQPGSSLSHFDSAATTNLLMEPAINNGLPIDLDLTRQQMRDIGWYRDSDAATSLGADTITGVQPTGAVYTNSPATVSWTNNGGFNRNVTIELSTDNGATFSTLASNIVNTGFYSFTAPNIPTAQARFRVTEYDFAAPRGESGNFSILAPTSASVLVSGRIKDALGRGVNNAKITVLRSNGSAVYAKSNPFGYFSVRQLEVGATYVFQVAHKRYTFEPQILNLTEDIVRLDFVAR